MSITDILESINHNIFKFIKKRVSPTLVEQAIQAVPGFRQVVNKLDQQVTLRGQSQSTLNNYILRIALFVLHFEKLPEQVSEDEINEYLVAMAHDPKSPSRSTFKHTVYGLRYYYRLLGMNKKAIALPALKQDTKLPIILNRTELKELFNAPVLLKQPAIDDFEKQNSIEHETAVECIKRIMGVDVTKCPVCQKGTMRKIREIPRIRSPNKHLPSVLSLLLA